MSTELVLVRHGRTSWNADGRLLGWTDVPLDPLGEDQARRLGAMLDGSRFARIWTSDLSRTVTTAALAGWDAIGDARLREIDFGTLEGHRWNDLEPKVRDDLTGFDSFEAPDGESARVFTERVAAFFDSLEPGLHLVVTHGGVIRAVLRMCRVDQPFPPHGVLHRVDWSNRSLLGVQTPTT